MTVYVDQSRIRYRYMVMSHMLADSVSELHAMADRIGLSRRWFQPGSTPHYDVCQQYRERAIRAGAIVVGRRGLIEIIQRLRATMLAADHGNPQDADGGLVHLTR